MAFSGKGNHHKAVEEISKVLEMNPDSPLLHKDRGTAYRKMGEYELAVKDLEKAIDKDKKFAPGYAALSQVYATSSDPKYRNPTMALRLAEKAISLSKPDTPDMLENLAEVQYAVNQKAAAVATLRRAQALDPSNKEYAELLKQWQGGSPVEAAVQEQPSRTVPFTNLW